MNSPNGEQVPSVIPALLAMTQYNAIRLYSTFEHMAPSQFQLHPEIPLQIDTKLLANMNASGVDRYPARTKPAGPGL